MTPTGILKRRNASGRDEFFYPVAYDMWNPRYAKNAYARVVPQRGVVGAVEIVTVTADQIAHGDFTPVHFYGDKNQDAQVWLTPETMLRHLQLIALALAKANYHTEEGARA